MSQRSIPATSVAQLRPWEISILTMLICATFISFVSWATVRTQARAETTLRFSDVSESSGIGTVPRNSWGSLIMDYDRDGDADLFVNRHAAPPILFRNGGESFVPVAEDSFYLEKMDRHGCAWGEANGDGRPDLYCTQGAVEGKGSGPNQLLIQTDSGFEDRAPRLGVENAYGRGRTINWIDYDSDGDLDIFLGNKHREGHPNVMFRNDGGAFRRARVGLSRELRTVSTSWSDWDSDGDPDLLVLQYEPHPAIAFENRGGRFAAVRIDRVTGRRWISGSWGRLRRRRAPGSSSGQREAIAHLAEHSKGLSPDPSFEVA